MYFGKGFSQSPSIQVASSGDGSNMQHVQVLPVQNTTGAAGQPIMLQSQVIQTADGQTLIYQPVQVSLRKMTKNELQNATRCYISSFGRK